MALLNAYLLAGIVFHKIYWEITKRRVPAAPKASPSAALRAVKTVKVMVLLGILVQVLIPWTILPLTADPAAVQAAGVALYTVGLMMAVTARAQLGASWSDIEAPGQVLQQELISRGLYRYVRHPIYTGDILLLLGLELALNSQFIYGIVLMIPAILIQAVREERLLMKKLPGYPAYCTRTKRFVPFVA